MDKKELIKAYYNEKNLIQSQIDSFNYFLEEGIKNIILNFDESVIPEYLLDVYNEINLKIKDVKLGEPEHVEVDGSITKLTPKIARLRGLTYSAPLTLTIETTIGSQKEKFEVQIAKMPIMLKSNKCVLYNKSFDELVELGEDPYEPGGYFIVNGTEKVVVIIEDLALNKFFVSEEDGEFVGRLFSERGVFKSLQTIKKKKDGTLVYSFGNFNDFPIFMLLKTLGLNDQEIVNLVGLTDENTDLLFQLSEYADYDNTDETLEKLAKRFGLMGNMKDRLQRVDFYLNNFILPHLGVGRELWRVKAKFIAKMLKKYLIVSEKPDYIEDKDNVMNKRFKLVGQLFEQLFISNFNQLVIDLLTNFQRMIKRGRYSSMKIIIREQLLTQKINSALAVGTWSDGRRGVAQYLKRNNFYDMLSHLTRVVSPLSTSRENFSARELHPTQYGRLCAIETPEGHSIGLRKNLALMAEVTYEHKHGEKDLIEKLEEIGLKTDLN